MSARLSASAELMGRIHQVGPELRKLAAQADRERRLPEASIRALKSTGVFGLNTPKRCGGEGAGARAMVEAGSALGYYCTNAGWIAVISSVSSVLPARFPQSLYERIYAEKREVMMASVVVSRGSEAVRDGDGYRVSGEWPFASNIWDSEWALGAAAIQESGDAKPAPGFVFLHKDQFTIRDVWYTIGMRGTGSNDFVAKDAWVPADQILRAESFFGHDFEKSPDAYFSQRLAPISIFGTTIVSPPLGAARAALDLTIEAASERPITYSNYNPQNRSGAFAQGVGSVRAKIDTAELCLLRAADTIDEAAMGTVPMPTAARARIRNDIGHATKNLGEAMNDIAWLHGTALFAEANPLGRIWRDVNTGIRHAIAAAPLNYEIAGAEALGVELPSRVI